ncbi:MAG: ATP-grasp domain-containing protein, partial [Planctomycetota bacterium]
EEAKAWLLHKKWVVCSAKAFVSDAESYLEAIGSSSSFFVRPDSPLKPFSGRVLQLDGLSLEALDYGFYFDDENLPIVVTPVATVGIEWRFVVSGQKLIAASSYEASNRSEAESDCSSEVWQFAGEVAENLTPPDPVYVLDVCQCENDLRLLELNPFSGADLYACNRAAIVAAIENVNLGQQTNAADSQSCR